MARGSAASTATRDPGAFTFAVSRPGLTLLHATPDTVGNAGRATLTIDGNRSAFDGIDDLGVDPVRGEKRLRHFGFASVGIRRHRLWLGVRVGELVVRLVEGAAELVLRFVHFFPSHQKTLAVGARVRVRGEVRAGFFGREMVHPVFKAVPEGGAPLAEALTPVYPASAQLPQAYLRKAVESGLRRAPLDEVLPAGVVPRGLPALREALQLLHHPPVGTSAWQLEERSHPAWQRIKFDELLAQQLSQLTAQRERARLRAPVLAAADGRVHRAACTRACWRRCPSD